MYKINSNYLVFLAILALAFLLRLPLLNDSFWMDEAAQALEIIRPLSQQLNIKEDFQPPLLHLILHFAQYFSVNESYLRLVGALLPSLVSLVFNYKLFKKISNDKTALITLTLLTTSSFHIFYSQELRPYALPLMWASMSWYYLYEYLLEKSETAKSKNKSNLNNNLFKVAVCNTLGLYSSYLYPFLIFGQIFYVIFKSLNNQKNKINFFKTQNLSFFYTLFFNAVTFAPWLPKFLEQLSQGGVVRETLPRWDEVVSIPQLKAIPLVFLKFIFGVVNIEPNFYYLGLSLFILVAVFIATYLVFINKNYQKSTENSHALLIAFSWFFVPLITAFIVSFFVPVVQPKRVLFSLPVFFYFLSFVSEVINRKYVKLAKVFLLVIFMINIVGSFKYYTTPELQRENWRDLRDQIRLEFEPTQTAIIYSFTDTFAPFVWYDISEFKNISTKYLYIKNVPDLNNTLKPALDYKTVLVFDYLRDLTDPEREIEKYLKNSGYEEIRALTYPNIGHVRVFVKSNELIGYKLKN